MEIHPHQPHPLQPLAPFPLHLSHHLLQILQHAPPPPNPRILPQDSPQRMAPAPTHIHEQHPLSILCGGGVLRNPAEVVGVPRGRPRLHDGHGHHEARQALRVAVPDVPRRGTEAVLREGERGLEPVGRVAQAEAGKVAGQGEEGGEVVVKSVKVGWLGDDWGMTRG